MQIAFYLSSCSTCQRIIKELGGLEDFEMQNISGAQNLEMQRYRNTLFFIESVKIVLSVLALTSIAIIGYVTITFWQKDLIVQMF